MIHELKIWPEWFVQVEEGKKAFEVRKNDRGFGLGDELILKEWQPIGRQYTGRQIRVMVSYILHSSGGLQEGYCIMAIRKKEHREDLR